MNTHTVETKKTPPPHILVVDDDDRLRALLTQFLCEQGYIVTYATDAADARRLLAFFTVDLVVMDVMMPKERGTVLAQELRAAGTPPVLLLTALGEANDRVLGLEAGADDYVVKPFVPKELLLRIANILMRTRTIIQPEKWVRFGEFNFDCASGKLSKRDEVIYLTTSEMQCLRLLARNAGSPVAREEIAALTGEGGAVGSERSVDVQINRLRKKIEAHPARAVYIQTVRHAGYALIID